MKLLVLSRWPVLIAIVLTLLTARSTHADEKPSRPNILLVMVDDMGYSDIGCYGGEIQTPTLDKLAANGVRLARFYNCAQCCPTRAALMSGLYPHQAGVGDMNEAGPDNPFWKKVGSPAYLGFKRDGIVTLPEAMQLAGYQTFMSGKWHLGNKPGSWPHDRGFDRCFALIGGACEQFTGYRSWQNKGPITLFVENNRKVDQLPENFYTTDTFTDHLLKFIDEADSKKPWFGYLSFTAPHWPLQAHAQDIAKYKDTYNAGPAAIRQQRFERLKKLGLVPESTKLSDLDPEYIAEVPDSKKQTWDRWMRAYAAMIDRVDQNMARIVELLTKRGQLDNTLILFLSDNGADTVHGPHWGQVSNTPFRKFKVSVHDGGIASPLIVHWPGGIPEKQRGKILHDGAGHVIDIFPTCLEAAQGKHPDKLRDQAVLPLEGVSLLPTVRGEKSNLASRTLYWERAGNEAVRQGQWKLVRSFFSPQGEGQVAKNDRIYWGSWELYRVDVDPGETNDLAAKEPERVQEMIRLHQAWANRVGVVPRDRIAELQNNN
ncbi:MAG: arylsulfatase [Gemmataceae bacterium]